jgi:hypothetical protein
MTPHEAEAELERLTRERKVPDVGKLKIARVLLLAGPDLALSRQAQSLLRISLVDERRTHLVPCKSADCGNTFVCREHGPSEPCPAGGKEGADRTWECPRCELRARDRQSDAMEQGAPRLHINAFDRAGEM